MKRLILIALIVPLFLISSCEKDNPSTKEEKKDWKLVWSEDFNSDELNDEFWSRIPRGKSDWNNYMTPNDACYEMRDGKLVLKGIKNDILKGDTATYLTGGVYTKGKKTFDYGKIVIRAKLGSAKGAWPAFWMLPKDKQWPMGGEIDIMEHLNYDNYAYQTVHSNYTVNLGIKDNPKHFGTNSINKDKFNTFTVQIMPTELRFFINNNFTFSYPKINTDKEGQYPFGKDFYLLLDMQLGGNWVGVIKDEDLPVEMEIDWVRYYELQ